MARNHAHAFLVTMSLITVFLFSGVVFGWGAFSAMLLKEGYYDYLCADSGAAGPCDAQMQALNSAFTLATTCVSLTAFLNGYLVDTFGPTRVTVLAGVMNFVGLLGIALTKQGTWSRDLSMHHVFDMFRWSTCLTAMGGSLTMFIGYQAPFLIPSRFTLLIELNSCLFDAGTIIFPILKVLYDLGVPFGDFFWAYTVLAAVCFSLFAVAWGMNEAELNTLRAGSNNDVSADVAEHERPLTERRMRTQLKSFEFVSIFIYFIVMVPRSNVYMGSVSLVNAMIADKEGTKDHLSFVDTVTGFVVPFGVLAVPFIEMSIHNLGIMATIQLTTALGVLYNSLQFIPVLYLQLATVCVFAVWRAFLYSALSAFNGEVFGVQTMGRIMGLCFFFSGISNMATDPLVGSAVAANNFTPFLIVNVVVCLPLPIIFYCLQAKRRLVTEARDPLTTPAMSRTGSAAGTENGGFKNALDPMGAMSMTRSRSLRLHNTSGPVDISLHGLGGRT